MPASQLATNPLTFDSADALPIVGFKNNCKIRSISFQDYTSATDTCQLQDSLGHVIWDGHGEADLSPVTSFAIGTTYGIQCTQITSGRVRVYFD